MNVYLKAKRDQYEGLRASIEGLQTRAVEAKRDLTDDELRSVREQSEQAAKLAEEIESLSEIETRNRKVADLAATVAAAEAQEGDGTGGEGAAGGDDQTRSRSGALNVGGGAKTQDRDPGHYTRSSSRSFFADLNRAREGDSDASARLAEHNRALSTGVAGAGIVPPKWLVDEYETLARQGRAVASAVRNIGLGNDPRPITLPKQVAGTDAVLAEQATENTHPAETDLWASGVDTVVPKPTSGIQVVSRQMLDMGSPAVDQLIYGDMIAAYNSKIETKVAAALVASAGAAVTTFATESAFMTGQAAHDAIVDVSMAVWQARKLPADLLVMSVRRWGQFKKLRDTTGRPLIPTSTAGPVNVIGVGSVQAAGLIEDLAVVATDGVGTGGYPDSIIAVRASDAILFESDVQRFRFEEVAGPESVKLGIWAYSAVIVRQAGKAAKRVVVTAA